MVKVVTAVMIGGRIGKDGIHGATFSSEELHKDSPVQAVQIGDPITFHLGNGSVATHRVIDIDPEARTFSTKGDANEDPDMAPVSFDNLIGKAGTSIPLIGYLPLYMRTPKGMFSIGAYVIVFILLQLIPEIIKPESAGKEGEETNEKKKGMV